MIHIKYCKNKKCRKAFDHGTNHDYCEDCRKKYKTTNFTDCLTKFRRNK